jgi:hypothetical protein
MDFVNEQHVAFLKVRKQSGKVAGLSIVGPLVDLKFAPIALARMLASVVLPRPGGPLSKMWSIGSLRRLAASTAISSRSFTLGWPVNSENSEGRSVISSATSGLFRLETARSGIARRMRQAPRSGKRDSVR